MMERMLSIMQRPSHFNGKGHKVVDSFIQEASKQPLPFLFIYFSTTHSFNALHPFLASSPEYFGWKLCSLFLKPDISFLYVFSNHTSVSLFLWYGILVKRTIYRKGKTMLQLLYSTIVTFSRWIHSCTVTLTGSNGWKQLWYHTTVAT